MIDDFKDALGVRFVDVKIQGPVFHLNGKTYEVQTFQCTSLAQFKTILLPLLKKDEGFALYQIEQDKVRGAIVPLEMWKVKVNHSSLDFPVDMLEHLGWDNQTKLEWFYDNTMMSSNRAIVIREEE